MPTNLVHTKSDEKKWAAAKHAATKKKGIKNKWAYIVGTYIAMKGGKKHGSS